MWASWVERGKTHVHEVVRVALSLPQEAAEMGATGLCFLSLSQIHRRQWQCCVVNACVYATCRCSAWQACSSALLFVLPPTPESVISVRLQREHGAHVCSNERWCTFSWVSIRVVPGCFPALIRTYWGTRPFCKIVVHLDNLYTSSKYLEVTRDLNVNVDQRC